MLTRILLPLDGSETAEKILTQIRPLVDKTKSEVILLVAIWPGSAAIMPGLVNDVLDQVEQQAQAYMQPLLDALTADGVTAKGVTRLGPPAEAILEVAREEDAALIAMTTHGRDGAARVLLGSVAERVVRLAPVPVLMIRSYVAGEDGSSKEAPAEAWHPKRILAPIDGSPGALAVGPFVAGMAELFGAGVDVLEVVPSPSTRGETSQAESAVDRAVAAFRDREGLAVEGHVRHAQSAAAGIVDFARREPDVGLIVLRTHGREGIPRWVLGSVSEEVVRHTDVPVLIARKAPNDQILDEWRLDEDFATGVEAVSEG